MYFLRLGRRLVGAELTVGGAACRDWGHAGDFRADLGDGFGFANGKAEEEGDAAEREEEDETVSFHDSPLDRNSADKHDAKLIVLVGEALVAIGEGLVPGRAVVAGVLLA